jgi:hypothetical protein
LERDAIKGERMNDIQIERSLKAIINKKEKEQIRQTRKSLEEARISLLSLLEREINDR